MTWSWKVRYGENATELSGNDTILRHLKYLLQPVQHLKVLEQYLEYLRATHERQPGTLACIVDDVANCAEWFDYEIESIGFPALRTALSRLSSTYRNEQKERNLQVFFFILQYLPSRVIIFELSGERPKPDDSGRGMASWRLAGSSRLCPQAEKVVHTIRKEGEARAM
jgi:hypothetical protein